MVVVEYGKGRKERKRGCSVLLACSMTRGFEAVKPTCHMRVGGKKDHRCKAWKVWKRPSPNSAQRKWHFSNFHESSSTIALASMSFDHANNTKYHIFIRPNYSSNDIKRHATRDETDRGEGYSTADE